MLIDAPLRDVYLHGAAAELLAPHLRLAVNTPTEALRLCAANGGAAFERLLHEASWRVVRGPLEGGLELAADELSMTLGQAPLHLVPVAAGARGGGKAILGAVLIATAILAAPALPGLAAGTGAAYAGGGVAGANLAAGIGVLGITYGNVALFGASLLLSGVSQLLSPKPKAIDATGAANVANDLFDGPVQVSAQGAAVPIGFGTMRVGGVVIASTLLPEDVEAPDVDPDQGGTVLTLQLSRGLDSEGAQRLDVVPTAAKLGSADLTFDTTDPSRISWQVPGVGAYQWSSSASWVAPDYAEELDGGGLPVWRRWSVTMEDSRFDGSSAVLSLRTAAP
jgi:predicted phage tail protein